jgi:tetratricopeptide (TPR) repeat protein
LQQARLTDCPVCHGAIAGAEAQCPSCSAELAPYYVLLAQANSLIAEANNAALRGDTEKARELAKKVLEITPLLSAQAAEVQARAALLERRYEDAWALAQGMEAGESREYLLADVTAGFEDEEHGKEHYNLALTAARNGQLQAAARYIGRALELAPHLDAAWRLAVMIALKGGEFERAKEMLATASARFPADLYISGLLRELINAA